MADRKTADARHGMPAPPFPTHNSPRVWFLTQGLSPLAVRLIRLLLAHGDHVAACVAPAELADDARSAEFRALTAAVAAEGPSGRERLRAIRCDGRRMGPCSAAVAETVQAFGRIDIVLCNRSEAVVGTVEELCGQAPGLSAAPAVFAFSSSAADAAVRHQFDALFFSQVHALRAVLPQLRAQHTGHLIALSSVGAHVAVPGVPMHTAAAAALEGYCDSLAYEVAPFNIRVTVVQPSTEAQLLTNHIVLVPELPGQQRPAPMPTTDPDADSDADSDAETNTASVRTMLTHVLNAHPDTALPANARTPLYRYPRLPAAALDRLLLETVHALAAIGGHENPPSRHIVGAEASAAVQDKLKMVTEELEDFVDASLAVDIFDSELKAEAQRVAEEP